MVGGTEITVRIPARDAGYIASMLTREVIHAKVSEVEERETFGHGPVITVDSDEVRSNLQSVVDACYGVLAQLADAGDESAKLALGKSTRYSPGANRFYTLEFQVERAVGKVTAQYAAERKEAADRRAAEVHAKRVTAGKKGAAARRAECVHGLNVAHIVDPNGAKDDRNWCTGPTPVSTPSGTGNPPKVEG